MEKSQFQYNIITTLYDHVYTKYEFEYMKRDNFIDNDLETFIMNVTNVCVYRTK